MATAKTSKPATTTDPIELAEKTLADARNFLTTRQAEAEQAVEEVADLKARLGWGDDSVTPEAMVRAQFDVDRTKGLITAAERDIKAAERNLTLVVTEHEPFLAEWVAEAIKANQWGWGLWGIPVSVGSPGTDAPAPSVWLSQVPPAERKGRPDLFPTGQVSGVVNLTVVTPDGQEMRDPAAIFNAARKLAQGAGGEVDAPRSDGRVVPLRFSNVVPGLPVLPMVTLRQPDAAPGALLRAISKAGGQVLKPMGSVGRLQSVPRIGGEVVGETSQVETVQDGRIVTRTIDGTLKLRNAGRELVEEVAERVAGTFAPGAGRIERVEVRSFDVRHLENHLGVYGTEMIVKVRMVVRFRLAR